MRRILTLLLAGVLLSSSSGMISMPEEHPANMKSNPNRFLEVQNWKGNITLTIKKKLLLEKGMQNSDYILIDHTFNYKFVSNDGEITTFDPFSDMPKNEIAQSDGKEPEKQTSQTAGDMKMAQDIMNNFDFSDPEGSLKKMNISFDSFKNWMAGIGYMQNDKSEIDYTIDDVYDYRFHTYGEGSKGCEIQIHEELKGRGRDHKISLLFSVNSLEGHYGFKFPFKTNTYSLNKTVTHNPLVCNETGDRFENEEKSINDIPHFYGRMTADPVVKKIPLPEKGMELSGSASIEGFYQVRNPLDDGMMSIDASISWHIYPANE